MSAFCQTPRFYRHVSDTRVCSTDAQANPAYTYDKRAFIVLMDGDTVGPSQWHALITALQHKGDVVEKYVFAPSSNSRWQKHLAVHGVNVIEVARPLGGKKDPNDLAIAMEAAWLASQRPGISLALAVQDVDFLYCARRIKEKGCHVTIAIPRSFVGLKKLCEDLEVDTTMYDYVPEDGQSGTAKFKAVLNSNGECIIESHFWDGHREPFNDSGLRRTLHELEYMISTEGPLLPSVAKFLLVNMLCPRVVWPLPAALRETVRIMKGKSRTLWQNDPGNLAFILPMGNQSQTTKSIRSTYGTSSCRAMCLGGGPFMLEDSDQLVPAVLKRLRYLDSELNVDLSEAIDVFCQTGRNTRCLIEIGIEIPQSFVVQAKQTLLRSALLSRRSQGTWKAAPNDTNIRRQLVSRGLIHNETAAKPAVFQAMKALAQQKGLPKRTNYTSVVFDLHKAQHQDHPDLRR